MADDIVYLVNVNATSRIGGEPVPCKGSAAYWTFDAEEGDGIPVEEARVEKRSGLAGAF